MMQQMQHKRTSKSRVSEEKNLAHNNPNYNLQALAVFHDLSLLLILKFLSKFGISELLSRNRRNTLRKHSIRHRNSGSVNLSHTRATTNLSVATINYDFVVYTENYPTFSSIGSVHFFERQFSRQ